MSRPSLHRRAEKVGDYYKQDLREDQVEETEFPTEAGAVGLNFGFG
jgi:hypothetical protein